LKYLSNKKGFLGIDNKSNVEESVVVVPFGLEKTVSYGSGTSRGPREIIKAFTINNAKSIKKEGEIGSINIGKNADLIILNKNLSKLRNHNEILEVKVINTIINGESQYRLN